MTEATLLPQEFILQTEKLFSSPLEREAFLSAVLCGKAQKGWRVNTLKLSRAQFLPYLTVPYTLNPYCADAIVPTADVKIGGHVLHHLGLFYSQEPSATAVVESAVIKAGDWVLDMCAAPGGKSTQLAAKIGEEGLLVCNEYVTKRCGALCDNLQRFGVRNAIVLSEDSASIAEKLPNTFDVTVVDSPCSGEGMFRKDKDAITEWSLENVQICAARSFDILSNAALTVKDGGTLVYSTCTFNTQENEGVIYKFLSANPQFELVPATDAVLQNSTDGLQVFDNFPQLSLCRRFFPHVNCGEGHFCAVMRKKGELSSFHPTSSAPLGRAVKPSRTAQTEYLRLYEELTSEALFGKLFTLGDRAVILPFEYPSLDGLRIISAGVCLAETQNGRHKAAQAFIASLKKGAIGNEVALSYTDTDLIDSFLFGNEISLDSQVKGFGVLTVDGFPLSLVKVSGDTVKNHYPKSLRKIK